MHESAFRSRRCHWTLTLYISVLLVLTGFSLLNWASLHFVYGNANYNILLPAIEDQIYHTHMNATTSQHLPYSASGAFQFCNLQTWKTSDDDSIHTYAVDQTMKQGGNTTQTELKSTEEIIEDFNLVPCVIPRDSLFIVLLVGSSEA